jgi:hypothetical protein
MIDACMQSYVLLPSSRTPLTPACSPQVTATQGAHVHKQASTDTNRPSHKPGSCGGRAVLGRVRSARALGALSQRFSSKAASGRVDVKRMGCSVSAVGPASSRARTRRGRVHGQFSSAEVGSRPPGGACLHSRAAWLHGFGWRRRSWQLAEVCGLAVTAGISGQRGLGPRESAGCAKAGGCTGG